MLISHESPISILDSTQYNDYDYCLVHLCETHPKYLNFFKRSIQAGREVLLDNSIFELKEAFDAVKYAEYVNEIKPTYFIVPDVLEDSKATIRSYSKFKDKYSSLAGMWMGAVQGQTYQDIVECYKFMASEADYIAISFDMEFYQKIAYTTESENKKLHRQCLGRQKLIDQLRKDGIWDEKKPHHLLGCSLAREFYAYRWTPSIRSVDTSNPVVGGILGQRYVQGIGLLDKSSIMLADLIDTDVSEDQFHDILHNVREFRKICNG